MPHANVFQEHATLASGRGVAAIVYTNFTAVPNTNTVHFSYNNGVSWTPAEVPFNPAANAAAPMIDFTSRYVHVLSKEFTAGGIQTIRTPIPHVSNPTSNTIRSRGGSW